MRALSSVQVKLARGVKASVMIPGKTGVEVARALRAETDYPLWQKVPDKWVELEGPENIGIFPYEKALAWLDSNQQAPIVDCGLYNGHRYWRAQVDTWLKK